MGQVKNSIERYDIYDIADELADVVNDLSLSIGLKSWSEEALLDVRDRLNGLNERLWDASTVPAPEKACSLRHK